MQTLTTVWAWLIDGQGVNLAFLIFVIGTAPLLRRMWAS